MLGVERKYRIGNGGAHPIREPPGDLDQAVGIADSRRGFDKEQAKSGEVNAYAERKNEDSSDGKTRRPAKKAESIMKVLKQAVEPAPSPDFTRVLDQAQLTAKGKIGGGLLLCHHFAMGGHLIGQLALQPASV